MPIKVFKSPHFPEYINGVFDRLFKECDIYVVESGVADNHDRTVEYLNGLSLGSPLPGKAISEYQSFNDKILKKISNSGKRIEKEKSRYYLSDIKSVDQIQLANNHFEGGNLLEACRLIEDTALEMAKMTNTRDEDLALQIAELQLNSPKKNILATLGTGHNVVRYLKELGIKASSAFPFTPMTVPLQSEGIVRAQYGLPISDTLLAQTLAATYLSMAYDEKGIPAEQNIRETRKALEKMSYGEIERLSEHISNHNLRNPAHIVDGWVARKGKWHYRLGEKLGF
jgi:hypothetical protein